jgi:hypothetical protein
MAVSSFPFLFVRDLTISLEIFDYSHKHSNLPGLLWVPPTHRPSLPDSQSITKYVERNYFDLVSNVCWQGIDEELLARIYDFDFKYWPASYIYHLTKSARLQPVRFLIERYNLDADFF